MDDLSPTKTALLSSFKYRRTIVFLTDLHCTLTSGNILQIPKASKLISISSTHQTNYLSVS